MEGACGPASAASIATFTNTAGLGSSVEFAAFVFGAGAISRFTTAQGHGGELAPNKLAFANTATPPGAFGGTHCIPDYYSTLPTSGTTPLPSTTVPATSGTYTHTGNLTLSGNLADGVRATLYVDGNLTIAGDIQYSDATGPTMNPTWSTIDDIPSLHVHVKGNIYIQSNVTNMVGFYTAQESTPGTGGVIYTCANGQAAVPATDLFNQCGGATGSQLLIRGALVANKVEWLRTGKSLRNAAAGVPANAAELIDLSPELFMVAPQDTPGNTPANKYQYFTTLPPVL